MKSNQPLSIAEINKIKNAYIKYLQEKDGMLITKNEWEFPKFEGKVIDALLKCNALDSDGDAVEFFVGINTIMSWHKTK